MKVGNLFFAILSAQIDLFLIHSGRKIDQPQRKIPQQTAVLLNVLDSLDHIFKKRGKYGSQTE